MPFLAETADEHLVRERKVYQKPTLCGSCLPVKTAVVVSEIKAENPGPPALPYLLYFV
jgi:hypothetical protein